jgi:hypothetical protein
MEQTHYRWLDSARRNLPFPWNLEDVFKWLVKSV